jgi:hypothetical protein
MQHPEQELVLRLVDRVVNAGRLDLVDELVHPDFFDHAAAASRACGPEGFRATVALLHESFAGFRLEPRDVLVDGAKVVVRATVSGRHLTSSEGRGEWAEQQIHIFRFSGDRLIEHWASGDGLGSTPPAV